VIPAGAGFTATATPIAGDRIWIPALQLFTSCEAASGSGNLCLASATGSIDGQQLSARSGVLRYVNNGAAEQAVWLAVSATDTVRGALFGLDVTIAPPPENVTCQAARALSDGMVLHNQDLAQARSDVSSICWGFVSPRMFYSARLLPRQSLRLAAVHATPIDGRPFIPLGILFSVAESCSAKACRIVDLNNVVYTNTASEPRTVIVEASWGPVIPQPPFNLHVTMPLPPAELSVLADRGLVTTEAGGQATFRVVLTSPPTAMVEVPLTSTDPAEGQVSPAMLRFSPEDWDRPQTATVTGVDDSKRDGARSYLVKVGSSVSADPRYQGLEGSRIALDNLDDEPGVRVQAPSSLVTSEGGLSATFRVVLNRAPTATVRLPLSSSDDTEGKVSTGELVFEPGNWSQPRTVTVLGLDDDAPDGSQAYQVILGAASSDDPDYQGIDPRDLAARNADDDFQRVPATLISGNLSCGPDYNGGGQSLAVDQASTLYAGITCEGTARVATSVDGGRTFGAPVDTGLNVHDVVIAAGRPGLVLAAGIEGRSEVVMSRSEDGGATWLPPRVMQSGAGNVRLAAAGDRVVLSMSSLSDSLLWVSNDGGRTFDPIKAPVPLFNSVGVDPDGTIWIVGRDGEDVNSGRHQFHSSADGGATWNSVVSLTYGNTFAVGATMVYAGWYDLTAAARDGSSETKLVASLPSPSTYFNQVLVAGRKDDVVVLSTSRDPDPTEPWFRVTGQVEVRRLASGDSAFSPPKTLGLSHYPLGAVGLSERAVAVVLCSGDCVGEPGHVSVAVEVWP
jgi:hypothetical protein